MTFVHLLRADLDRAATTLASGFGGDPFFAWIYPDASQRPAQLSDWMRLTADQYLDKGHAYTTDAGHAVALWSAPDGRRTAEDDRAVRHLLGEQIGPAGLDRVLPVFAVIGRHHPHEPHYYLSTVATHADHQGRGLAAGLLRPVLDRCDAMGLPAYLESSNPRNLSFYERLGFVARGRVDVPDADDVWLTPMWRDPRDPS